MLGSAEQQVVIVAPFILRGALSRLLEEVADGVRVVCITRWLAQDFWSGVADLSPWELLHDWPGSSSIRSHPSLHAKYYRADGRCMVGSANVTMAALGWARTSNLEILVDGSLDDISGFEDLLLQTSTEVTAERVAELRNLLDALTSTPSDEEVVESPTAWTPSLRNPEQLWAVFSGNRMELSKSALHSADLDLGTLNLPSDLDQATFDRCVRVALNQTDVVHRVDQFAGTPRRFGEMRELLRDKARSRGRDSAELWQTLMRWLLHFDPEQSAMDTPGGYSEVFQRIRR